MNLNRRKWLRRAMTAAALTPVAGLSYAFLETGWIEITRPTIRVPRLPSAFSGLRVAVLTDIHHSLLTPIKFVSQVVDRTNAEKPDIVALVGDFVEGRDGVNRFDPCFAELDRLAAPLGVIAVPGNHDYWNRIVYYHRAVARTKIQDLTNNGTWLYKDGQRLRVGGVDDLWCGRPNLPAALGDANDNDACLVLCHNPDYVERLTDPRVGLVFGGHMHGGQVRLPFINPPVPSRYGTKYLHGLVQGPVTQVYVSRGLGTVSVPFRFRARPEIVVATLTS
jgi:predicted MPP superfamily phosphohydrolase